MKRRSDSIAQKRAIYTVSYLKHLLKDPTFISYFNVFLNLPVFPRRITYLPGKECFSIEPVLSRRYINAHNEKVMAWLSEVRLPMFTRSHTYFHYRMCKEVLLDHPLVDTFTALESQYADIPRINDVMGFYNFHHFVLIQESGRPLVETWLAIERLHSLVNEDKADFLEHIFDSYLMVPSSPRSLPDHYRSLALKQLKLVCKDVRFVNRGQEFLQQFKDKLLRERKLFRPLQDAITEDLRDYWLHRFYTHLEKQLKDKTTFEGIRRRGSSIMKLLAQTPDIISPDEDPIAPVLPSTLKMKLCSSNGLRRTSQVVFEPQLRMDIPTTDQSGRSRTQSMTERNLKNLRSRIQDESAVNRRRNSEVGGQAKRRSTLAGPTERKRSMSITGMDATPEQLDSFDLAKKRLLKRLQNGRRPSGLMVTNATTASVDWSRHKLSRTRELEIQKFLRQEVELFSCCPCSLRDEIYKENYCDALTQVFNETSLKEVDINNLLEIAIASDAIGGEDFKGFLTKKCEPSALYNYQLWVDLERFAHKYSTEDYTMFCARGYAMSLVGFFSEQDSLQLDWSFTKNQMADVNKGKDTSDFERELHSLLYKYTHPDGKRYTQWDDPFTDSLWFAIVNRYSVVEWLTLAQKFAAKRILDHWLRYIEDSENEFLDKCTVLKTDGTIPPFLHHTSEDLIYETLSSPNTRVMWAAMQLAEAIEYPGHNLPVLSSTKAERTPSPESRCGSAPHTPTTLFGDQKPPTRRALAAKVENRETSPEATISVMAPQVVEVPAKPITGRRGDAISSMIHLSDPTLSQLEYNLTNTSGLDLSTDRLNTIPKSFMDVMRTRELLAKFRQFLSFNEDNQDPSILFYQIVESLKACRNPKQRQDRMHFIQQQFFGAYSPMLGKVLMDKNGHVYKELCNSKKVTHTILLSAQTLICKEMETVYWLPFLEAFPAHIREKIISMNTRNATEKKEFGKEKNRRLWVNFTINVINFKRGIMDPTTCSHFREFLGIYVQEVSARCTKNTQKRQIVNNKLIDIEKIQADLDFFIEVERYKEVAETVQMSARLGNYDPAEEQLLVQKGRCMFFCYIDSLLPPKVQINITHDKVGEIRKLHEAGIFERGIFHDAALSIFPSLTYFWKKFCLQQFSPSKGIKVVDSEKLILKERGGKQDYKNKLKASGSTMKPAKSSNYVVQVSHIAASGIHLLCRYTESSGLTMLLAQKATNEFRRGMGANSVASQSRSVMSTAGEGGRAESATSRQNSLLAGTNNYVDRRGSIMTPGRLQRVREMT